jgi:hypothetical protein
MSSIHRPRALPAFLIAVVWLATTCAAGAAPPSLAGTYLMGGGDGYLRLDSGTSGVGVRLRITDSYKAWMEGPVLCLRTNPRLVIDFGDRTTVYNIDDFRLTTSCSTPGDWDLTNFQVHYPDNKELADPVPPCPRLLITMPSFLHRLDDMRIPQYFAATLETTSPAILMPLASAVLSAHPDDPHVRLLALDALLRTRNFGEAEQRVGRWGAALDASGNAMFAAAATNARSALRAAHLSASGRNAFECVAKFRTKAWDPGYFEVDLQRVFRCEAFVTPFANRDRADAAENHLYMQAAANLGVDHTETMMKAGRREDALALLLNLYRLGQLLNQGDTIKARSWGIAVRGIACRGLLNYVLKCCDSAADCDVVWRHLELLNAQELPGFPAVETVAFSWIPFRFTPTAKRDQIEHETRHRVANARFQALRTAVAARRHRLGSGNLPAAASDFAPLLPAGPPMDPWGTKPLRWKPAPRNWTCYSIGPDGQDNLGELLYDSTNGTISAGDIVQPVPRDPQQRYPRFQFPNP